MSQILLAAFGTPEHNPGKIPGIIGWFKGSEFDATTDGTEITSWTDVTATANAPVVGSGGDRPTVSRNSINTSMTSVMGSNESGVARLATIADKTTFTVFAVINFTASAVLNYFWRFGDGNSNGIRMGLDTNDKFLFVVPNAGGYPTNETVSTSAWHYLVLVSNAGIRALYLDGALLTWASTPSATQDDANPAGIGIFEGGVAQKFQGLLAECAVFNTAVSTDDRTNNLEQYAIDRFGL